MWGHTTDRLIRNAQTLHNDAARFIAGIKLSTIDLIKQQGWLTIEEMRGHSTLQQLWKIIRMEVPRSLFEQITLGEDYLVQTDTSRLQHTCQSFRLKACALWNRLPVETRQITKFHNF